MADLVAQVQGSAAGHPTWRVQAIDSTCIRLSAALSPWSQHGKATPEGDLVLRDETITLGSPNNRHGMVIPGLRLIHRRNRGGCERAFVTDRLDLTAFQLVRLYRYRWQIELFFRSLKHQLGLMVPFGHSAAAVWLSVLIAMIVMLVQALVEVLRPAATSRVAWNDGIGMVLIIFLALPDG